MIVRALLLATVLIVGGRAAEANAESLIEDSGSASRVALKTGAGRSGSALQGDLRADSGPPATQATHLVVKYRSRGDHALLECAERLSSRGESFQAHLVDGDESLDRLHARLGLVRYEAVFRKTDGPDFESERLRLAERLERARAARSSRRGPPVARAELPDLAHVYRVPIPEGQDLESVAQALRADVHVEYAHPDYGLVLDQTHGSPLDDPFLDSSGSWGQPYADLWGLDRIGARDAWLETLGEGIVVAVVDTGLDPFHPDIVDNIWVNPGEDLNRDGRAGPEDLNGIDDDGNGFIDDLTGFDFANSVDADGDGLYDGPDDISDSDPFDDVGHGTHVAGTIAAVGDNGLGIAGVAPRAKIMALKGFPEEGSALDTDLWSAVLYAALNGASVVNNSWSCGSPCPSNPLAEDVLAHVEALGTVVVTSAGNRSDDVVLRSPENTTRVITVGALGFDDRLAYFSNHGWGIDVVAPGGGPATTPGVVAAHRNILSLRASSVDPVEDEFTVAEEYLRLAGTSMSAPHVAGAVALLQSVRPELTPAEIRRLVRITARDLGFVGHDPVYGPGALDLPPLLAGQVPGVDLEIGAPRSGTIHDPALGPLEIRVLAEGPDLDSLELSIARGRSGRIFLPLESFPDSGVLGPPGEAGPVVHARWDLAAVEDGPYVLRARARLLDGQEIDEYVVLGIERPEPIEIARVERNVRAPDISGRRIAWPMAQVGDSFSLFDMALGFLRPTPLRAEEAEGMPAARPPRSIELGSDASDAALDHSNMVWRVGDGVANRLEWCRLERRRFAPKKTIDVRGRALRHRSRLACDAEPVTQAPGFFAPPWAAGGWLVWQRNDGAERFIEGCRVDLKHAECVPQSLVPLQDPPRWTLRSFDGETLLLQSGRELSLCRLGSAGPPCELEPIPLASGTPPPSEPVHDGRLLVFDEVTIERIPPEGCLPWDLIPECASSFEVLSRHRACWLDEIDRSCDSIPISGTARVEALAGIAVSGRHIVWSVAPPLEVPSIRFCEFQPRINECIEQRLSGSLAPQDSPAIDAARVTWRGARDAGPSIWGYDLPEIGGSSHAKVRAGRLFSLPLRARRGSSRTLRYEIEGLESGSAPDPALEKVEVEDRGRPGGRIRLRGVFSPEARGDYPLRIRAIGESGLYSEWILELGVLPPPSVEARKARGARRALRRSGRVPAKAHKPDR